MSKIENNEELFSIDTIGSISAERAIEKAQKAAHSKKAADLPEPEEEPEEPTETSEMKKVKVQTLLNRGLELAVCQRGIVHDKKWANKLIETITSGGRVPPLTVVNIKELAEEGKPFASWRIVDGQQRLHAIMQALELCKKYNVPAYDKIMAYVLWVEVITVETEEQAAVVFNHYNLHNAMSAGDLEAASMDKDHLHSVKDWSYIADLLKVDYSKRYNRSDITRMLMSVAVAMGHPEHSGARWNVSSTAKKAAENVKGGKVVNPEDFPMIEEACKAYGILSDAKKTIYKSLSSITAIAFGSCLALEELKTHDCDKAHKWEEGTAQRIYNGKVPLAVLLANFLNQWGRMNEEAIECKVKKADTYVNESTSTSTIWAKNGSSAKEIAMKAQTYENDFLIWAEEQIGKQEVKWAEFKAAQKAKKEEEAKKKEEAK